MKPTETETIKDQIRYKGTAEGGRVVVSLNSLFYEHAGFGKPYFLEGPITTPLEFINRNFDRPVWLSADWPPHSSIALAIFEIRHSEGTAKKRRIENLKRRYEITWEEEQ